ncbi:hypothetical protein TYRP_007581 [Tyrophagus putrescentiae]|nr:hypothetical protein TYRP_007581 [Tyrophagus putrescentiae]
MEVDSKFMRTGCQVVVPAHHQMVIQVGVVARAWYDSTMEVVVALAATVGHRTLVRAPLKLLSPPAELWVCRGGSSNKNAKWMRLEIQV